PSRSQSMSSSSMPTVKAGPVNLCSSIRAEVSSFRHGLRASRDPPPARLRRMRAGLAAMFVAAAVGGCGFGGSGSSGDDTLPHSIRVHVIRAVDGDTALVRLRGRAEY